MGLLVGGCSGKQRSGAMDPSQAQSQTWQGGASAGREGGAGPGNSSFSESGFGGPGADFGGPGPGFGPPGLVGPAGMQGSLSMLLAVAEVQKELGLRGDQAKQAEELLRDLQEQSRAVFDNFDFQEMQSLGREEREKRLAAVGKKAEETSRQADEKVAGILDAKQAERLSQLRLQREGLAAFSRPEIARQLGLTEEQQAKIKNRQAGSRFQARGRFGEFGGPGQSEEDRRAQFGRMQQEREKAQAEVFAALTAEQKAKWAEMKGKEFQFPRPQGPGFAPGGPGGAGALASVKTQIRASDEEWKVIGPKLRQVLAARAGRGNRHECGRIRRRQRPARRLRLAAGARLGPRSRRPRRPRLRPRQFHRAEQLWSGWIRSARILAARACAGSVCRSGRIKARWRRPGLERVRRIRRQAAAGRQRQGRRPACRLEARGDNRSIAARGAAGGPDRFPGGGPPGFGGRDFAIAQAMADLQAAAADAKTSADELKKKVAAVRIARQKARDKLEAAKKELLELLAPDQEAVLVGLGCLD